jgi:hypothetical protein
MESGSSPRSRRTTPDANRAYESKIGKDAEMCISKSTRSMTAEVKERTDDVDGSVCPAELYAFILLVPEIHVLV